MPRHLPHQIGQLAPHVLRHFAASDLYRNGMDVVAIQEILGHEWLDTTMIYVHVEKSHADDAIGIESLYCRPGIEGAHEKGGVECQIGYFQRNHFVPVPEVSSFAELNEFVGQWDRQDDVRRIGSGSQTSAEDFALERRLLMPLPVEPCETGRLFTPRVDRYGQIPVRTNRYSVPIRLIGKRVRVILHTSHLVVHDQNVEVARHERLIAKGAVRLGTNTWRSWSANQALPPVRPLSNRPARPASSPRCTTPGGSRQ
ncbi:Mu transposase domain-containing protein [Streptomyces hydrogenans]